MRRVDLITGMDIRNIKSIKVIPTFQDNVLLVYNDHQLASVNSCLQIYGNDVKDQDGLREDEDELATEKRESVLPE